MAGFQKRRFQNLMTGRARRGANVKTAKIAHPRSDASAVSPIFSRMSAEPATGRAMASLTRNAFRRMRVRPEAVRRDGLERGVANRATRTCFRRRNTQSFGDPLRARVQQDGVRFGVKIFLAPGEILA